ncbi:MAG TPA: arylsulfotransferase family protein [Solirubrobacteraceae bacterium]|nr:arylsulfotransferase family protein [Solirubrobacteraceae bacterium]
MRKGSILAAALAMLAATLVSAGAAGAAGPSGARTSTLGGRNYISAPALHPAPVRAHIHGPRRSPGLIFLDPFASSAKPLVGEAGALIMAEDGSPVWFHPAPAGEEIVDFRAQRYLGRPVLTWWQGTIAVPPKYTNLPAGSPEPGARFLIYNDHYQQIAVVKAPDGWTPDLHELLITPRGSALFIASKVVTMNLTPYGGPAEGRLEDFAVQEVNIRSGKLLFEWNMLKHVPLSEAQTAPPAVGVWDPYHMNSVAEYGAHDLLISARNTWAIYKVARSDGSVLWQLGGRGSSIKLPADGAFYWQHDARPHGKTLISLFDDGCCNVLAHGLAAPEQSAHGLLLRLNLAKHTAAVVHTYSHTPPLDVPSQGNVQMLANGNVFIGWGQLPYLSEYTRSGRLLYEATLPEADESYRAFREHWEGRPLSRPSLVAVRSGKQATAYVSWNGATDVARWEIFAGSTARALRLAVRERRPAAKAPARGFQTALPIAAGGSLYEALALGRRGQVIGSSGPQRLGAKAGRALAAIRHASERFAGASAPAQSVIAHGADTAIRVICPVSAFKRCTVRLTLQSAHPVKLDGRTKLLTLASASATIMSGASALVRLTLGSQAQSLLRSAHGGLTPIVILASADGHGAHATTRRQITLRSAGAQSKPREEPSNLY